MASYPVLLSIEEYLHTSYQPDVDFVDGEIEERNLGEYQHAQLQTLIAVLFAMHDDVWGTDAIVEQRIRIGTSRVRICDVAILRADAPHEEVTATPPLICIEVRSREDRKSRIEKRLADYFAMGVANIWWIDPIRRVAHTYSAKGLQPLEGEVLTVPGTPVRLDLTEIFAKLDKKLAAHNRI